MSMNPSRPHDFKLRLAGFVAGCLVASTLSAQSYAPYSYAPAAAYYGPYGAAGYMAQPYGSSPGAAPAVYRRLPQGPGPQYQSPADCPPYPPRPDMQSPYPSRLPPVQPQQQPRSGEGTPGQQQQPQQQQQQPDQQQQQAQQQQPQQQDQPQDFTPSPEASSQASLTPGMNTPQLGRVDQANRLNIFDNMAAAPQTRIWFGYQFAKAFDTALRGTSSFQSFLSANPSFTFDDLLRRNENGVDSRLFRSDQRVFRLGAEWAPCTHFSIAVQGQYYNTDELGDAPDDWTNPQIMLKYMLCHDFDSVLTATMGITPETSNDFADINETTTKFYPGALFYEGLTPDLFTQGGLQFGLPVNGGNEVYTADWSVALGWWAYRDPCPCGPGHDCRPNILRAFKVTGIIPQVNVLGKHTLGDRQILGPFGFRSFATSVETPFGTVPAFLPEGFVIYDEPRAVIDLSAGGQILFGQHLQLGLGYSVPLSDEVRDSEFISTLTYLF
jgi:hypothetical protein